MARKKTLKTVPLGLPMAFSLVGTVISLTAGKNFHAGFGVLWTVLSLWHAAQHCGAMKKNAADIGKLLPACGGEKSELKQFVAATKIAAFTEGRLRVYNDALKGNEKLAAQVEEYVLSFTGVKTAQANTLTGSLLIEYDPQKLRGKKGLAALEAKIGEIYKNGKRI